ncbi:MAG: FG-GAP repeat protein, partial [Phycisphaerales bacterium]
MNESVRRWGGLSVISLWLVGAVNESYAQDACLDARVTAFDGGVFQSFGFAVGVYGDTALIGAQWDNDQGTQSGSTYVFRREGGTWVEVQKLLASDGYSGSRFGFAVAIEGDVALIGAVGHQHDGQSGSGSAYVFRYNGAMWIEEQELFASDGGLPDNFGASVSLSPDSIGVAVIGARLDDDNGANSGSAYVFRFDPQMQRWVEEQHLLASDGAGGDFFGRSVAVQGDTAIIGANGHDDACRNNPICDSGAAYVFRFDPKTSTWIETQKLLASDAAPNAS